MEHLHYRDKIYDKYVSSGQAKRSLLELNPEKNFQKHKPFVTKVIKKFFPSDRTANILDIACGTGVYIHYAKKLGYSSIAGIDISKEQVDLAHKLGIPEVQHVNLFEYLQNRTEKFDCILLMDILEHLTKEELLKLLSALSTVLQPKARIIIHIPNAEGIFGMRVMYGDLTHENCFTPFSIGQVLELNGLKLVRCVEDKPIVHSPYAFVRRVLWEILTLYPRLMLFSETAQWKTILSQNMTIIAENNS
ncbi:MAG: class I SAM-dependent methyltransferase [Chitinophagaceae bacterium]|nr:class I SAM-dependent methyltransferase [Chitinophagaceae bacterium]